MPSLALSTAHGASARVLASRGCAGPDSVDVVVGRGVTLPPGDSHALGWRHGMRDGFFGAEAQRNMEAQRITANGLATCPPSRHVSRTK